MARARNKRPIAAAEVGARETWNPQGFQRDAFVGQDASHDFAEALGHDRARRGRWNCHLAERRGERGGAGKNQRAEDVFGLEGALRSGVGERVGEFTRDRVPEVRLVGLDADFLGKFGQRLERLHEGRAARECLDRCALGHVAEAGQCGFPVAPMGGERAGERAGLARIFARGRADGQAQGLLKVAVDERAADEALAVARAAEALIAEVVHEQQAAVGVKKKGGAAQHFVGLPLVQRAHDDGETIGGDDGRVGRARHKSKPSQTPVLSLDEARRANAHGCGVDGDRLRSCGVTVLETGGTDGGAGHAEVARDEAERVGSGERNLVERVGGEWMRWNPFRGKHSAELAAGELFNTEILWYAADHRRTRTVAGLYPFLRGATRDDKNPSGDRAHAAWAERALRGVRARAGIALRRRF